MILATSWSPATKSANAVDLDSRSSYNSIVVDAVDYHYNDWAYLSDNSRTSRHSAGIYIDDDKFEDDDESSSDGTGIMTCEMPTDRNRVLKTMVSHKCSYTRYNIGKCIPNDDHVEIIVHALRNDATMKCIQLKGFYFSALRI
jgi:hypothetical protein